MTSTGMDDTRFKKVVARIDAERDLQLKELDDEVIKRREEIFRRHREKIQVARDMASAIDPDNGQGLFGTVTGAGTEKAVMEIVREAVKSQAAQYTIDDIKDWVKKVYPGKWETAKQNSWGAALHKLAQRQEIRLVQKRRGHLGNLYTNQTM
jgi:hypothetical protein